MELKNIEKSKMKICLVIADITCSGGIERVLNVLSEKFNKESHEVTILSLYRTNEILPYEFSKGVKIEYINDRISYSGAPSSVGRLIKHVASIYKLRGYFKSNQFEAVVFNGFPMSFLGFFCKNIVKKIVIEHVHYGYYKSSLRRLRHQIYQRFEHLVVLTKNDKASFESDGLKNVKVIGNPRSFQSEKKSSLNNKKIISIGRLEEQKGYDLLIPVFENVNKKHPDWELVIFGTGTLYDFLFEKISQSSCSDKIKLMGKTNDVKTEYLSSSMFVLSSRYEGFGMVLVEAMECGLPCISFDCPNGPSDIIDHGVDGYLVRPGNLTDMEDKICHLISNSEDRRLLSNQAIYKASLFDVDEIYNKWLRIL